MSMEFLSLYVLWIIIIPFLLSRKKYIEREKPRLIIFLLSLPLCCLIIFLCFFVGHKGCCFSFTKEDIFNWFGCSLLAWLATVPVIFWGAAWRSPRWEKHIGEIEDDVDNLFDSAIKIAQNKRNGKDTSRQEAEYRDKLRDFENNG
jgi:hypothetical protein